jgi:hypothetical protein
MDDKKVYIFTCTPEFGELIESVSKHIEGGTEVLFQKSLVLMSLAIKINKSGNKLAILDSSGKVMETIEI